MIIEPCQGYGAWDSVDLWLLSAVKNLAFGLGFFEVFQMSILNCLSLAKYS